MGRVESEMNASDTPRIQPNGRLHWCLLAVAMFEGQHDRAPTSKEVHLTAQVFEEREEVYDGVSRLYNRKSVISREREGRGYRYSVNDDGVMALWILGTPTEGPSGEGSGELGFDLSSLEIPEWVRERDVGYDAADIPLRESHGLHAEDPGGFESPNARKHFFATLDREAERHEWEPGATHKGEVRFEGEEALAEEVFGDDEDEEEDEEDEIPVGREGIDPPTSDPEPEVELVSFDPGPDGKSPRHEPTPDSEPSTGEVIGTVNFEPEWDWVGVQMAKLGYPSLARRAFEEKLTPAEVYGPVMELIYENRFNPDANLDLGSRVEGGLTVSETPVTPETVEAAKEAVGAT